MKAPLRSLAIPIFAVASLFAPPGPTPIAWLKVVNLDGPVAVRSPEPSRLADLIGCDPNVGPRMISSNLNLSNVRNRRRRRRRRNSEDVTS